MPISNITFQELIKCLKVAKRFLQFTFYQHILRSHPDASDHILFVYIQTDRNIMNLHIKKSPPLSLYLPSISSGVRALH